MIAKWISMVRNTVARIDVLRKRGDLGPQKVLNMFIIYDMQCGFLCFQRIGLNTSRIRFNLSIYANESYARVN